MGLCGLWVLPTATAAVGVEDWVVKGAGLSTTWAGTPLGLERRRILQCAIDGDCGGDGVCCCGETEREDAKCLEVALALPLPAGDL
mmetsp:Transcript_34667/g.64210  ORF Transcript_34667/g.64210 Transcript_34667/m.64210 type:complete len:86 (-) Transcript_34667:1679-1936(-)